MIILQKKMKPSHSPYEKPGTTSPSRLMLQGPHSPPHNNSYSNGETHSPLSLPKYSNTNTSNAPQLSVPLPGLHVTLAELAESLAPIHLPPLDSSLPNAPTHLKSEPSFKDTAATPSTNSSYLSNTSYHSSTQNNNYNSNVIHPNHSPITARVVPNPPHSHSRPHPYSHPDRNNTSPVPDTILQSDSTSPHSYTGFYTHSNAGSRKHADRDVSFVPYHRN